MSKRLISINLFAGAGGFSAGLVRSGVTIVGALDNWPKAVKSYRANFHHPIVERDIRATPVQDFLSEIDYAGNVDLLVGGPPCQGFSIQRIGADSDRRNNLVLEFARYVREIRPRMFVMENVLGLIGKRGRPYVEQVEKMLNDVGYEVRAERINAAEYGVPQTRKRVFLSGWLFKRVSSFKFPSPLNSIQDARTVGDAIGDLPSPPEDFRPALTDPLHRRTRLTQINLERLRHVPPGGGMEHLPKELRVDCHKDGASRIGHRYVYGRLAADKPANTITARFDSFTRGRFAHPFEDRNITLREGARLQTFDDSHVFTGTQEEIAAQIGNAVPPRLAEIVGRAIIRHLSLPTLREVSPLSDQVELDLCQPASAS